MPETSGEVSLNDLKKSPFCAGSRWPPYGSEQASKQASRPHGRKTGEVPSAHVGGIVIFGNIVISADMARPAPIGWCD